MRIAFTVIGGSNWTGGLHYLENLLAVISEYGHGEQEVLLIVSEDVDEDMVARLRPYISGDVIKTSLLNNDTYSRLKKLIYRHVLQRDFVVERICKVHGVDLIFQHQAWYGLFFKIPTLAWIADFQHRKVSSMFSISRYIFRDVGYRALSYCADRILVSSCDAFEDCKIYYPRSKGKISVLQFATRLNLEKIQSQEGITEKYNLPTRYIYLPNQFWKHKNHQLVIDAVTSLRPEELNGLVIALSGKPEDLRHPDYAKNILEQLESSEVSQNIVYLGFIPYDDILPLMSKSVAVLNPSYCEGWSTTVEEAKSLQKHLLLSDIPIHREQANSNATFFDHKSKESLAEVFKMISKGDLPNGNVAKSDSELIVLNKAAREAFCSNFLNICKQTTRS